MAAKKLGKVAIIYSDEQRQSSESRNLAHYLCGLLSTSGYAQIVMIPFSSEGPIADLSSRRISYIPPKQSKPIEVPGADFSFAYFNAITECHMVVVTVNSMDTVACGQRLAEVLQNRKHIPIFSLQRGVRHGTSLSEEIETKGITMLEAAVGFAVVVDPKSSAFISTVKSPAIVFERMSKEKVKIADGPLRLLETMNLEVNFRKVLTPFAWGILVYENLYALNILTKGTLLDTLSRREWRLIYALMIRENLNTLIAAAGGGSWKPDILLISSILSPKLLEIALIMPNFVFNFLFYILDIFPTPNVISPGQFDLMEGRKTMTTNYLSELVEAGKRNNCASPACELVLSTLQTIENHLDSRLNTYTSTNYIDRIQDELEKAYPVHETMSELQYWLVRALAAISVFVLLLFMFYHD